LLKVEEPNATSEGGHKKFIFLHIPKNAGTTAEEAGSMAGVSWGAKDLGLHGQQLMDDGNTCPRWHVPPTVAGEPSQYHRSDTRVFCISRHPYDRAVSEYKYLLSVPWGRHNGKQMGVPLGEHPVCSEEDLNLFIQRSMDKIQQNRRYIFDCHFVPQVQYIWNEEGERTCHDIIPLSELSTSFDDLMERRGHPARLPKERFNKHKDACEGLTKDNLTKLSKAMLNEVYAKDFKKLNYTPSRDVYDKNTRDALHSGAARTPTRVSRLLMLAVVGTLPVLL
jgi:hypothetical protein